MAAPTVALTEPERPLFPARKNPGPLNHECLPRQRQGEAHAGPMGFRKAGACRAAGPLIPACGLPARARATAFRPLDRRGKTPGLNAPPRQPVCGLPGKHKRLGPITGYLHTLPQCLRARAWSGYAGGATFRLHAPCLANPTRTNLTDGSWVVEAWACRRWK